LKARRRSVRALGIDLPHGRRVDAEATRDTLSRAIGKPLAGEVRMPVCETRCRTAWWPPGDLVLWRLRRWLRALRVDTSDDDGQDDRADDTGGNRQSRGHR